MDLSTPEGQAAINAFNNEISSLTGNALLDRQIEFDALPPAQNDEADFRLNQSLSLEAALNNHFGLGAWQKPLADRRGS